MVAQLVKKFVAISENKRSITTLTNSHYWSLYEFYPHFLNLLLFKGLV